LYPASLHPPCRCVVCPYHGWAFDAEGKLRDVPSAEHGSWPKRPLVGAYDVEERGGFVWLFYGSKSMPADERPPIPTTPELEDSKWRAGEKITLIPHCAISHVAVLVCAAHSVLAELDTVWS
jgi:phenylpropionate dioxygenase-like ring-hydroxylating dioxygenase large terminal subunit